MPIPLLLFAFAMQSAQAEPITVVGNAWAPFISPMGEPFRPKAAGDDTLATWFRQADRDGDGMLTAPEMKADAERFFAVLDQDRNGEIHPEEFVAYEWDMVPEVQVNSRLRRARGEPAPRDRKRERDSGYDPHALQGAARYALLNIPQPVAAADTNFDRAVSMDEFRKAAERRFQLLDRKGDLQLTLTELQALRPDPRELRRRSRPRGDARDARIGNPVPTED